MKPDGARLSVLFVSLALLCTGCSPQGSTEASPEDFGVPVPPGSTVVTLLLNRTNTPAGPRLMQIWNVRMKAGRAADALQFYRKELPRRGWRVRNNNPNSGMPLGVQLVASHDRHQGGLMVMAEDALSDNSANASAGGANASPGGADVKLIYVAHP